MGYPCNGIKIKHLYYYIIIIKGNNNKQTNKQISVNSKAQVQIIRYPGCRQVRG